MSEWRHRPSIYDGSRPLRAQVCLADGQLWPCDAEQMRLALDAERARTEVLTEALREWKCPACGGSGRYKDKGERTGFEVVEVECHVCGGDGIHPKARDALAVLPDDRVGVEPLDEWAEFICREHPVRPAVPRDRISPAIYDWACAECTVGQTDPPTIPGFRCVPHQAAARLIESPTEGETR